MKAQPGSHRLTTTLMLVAAVLAAGSIGAWQSISPSPTEVVEQHSAFVQSGGAMTDLDPGMADVTQALSHARAPSESALAATKF